jgi:pyruvate/2-oxoglutarate dehydrogenase complex dihydrolipoamide acyltransferase (E2) component
MSKLTEVRLPDIGDFDEVEIIEILVAAGDTVEQESSLITLESDKATMEIPSPANGQVKEILVSVGDKIAEGAVILMLEEQDGTAEKTDKTDTARVEKDTVSEKPAAEQPVKKIPFPKNPQLSSLKPQPPQQLHRQTSSRVTSMPKYWCWVPVRVVILLPSVLRILVNRS